MVTHTSEQAQKPAEVSPVRPKAFRRPPGWVAPPKPVAETALAKTSMASTTITESAGKPATTHILATAEPRNERWFSVVLLAAVVLINVLAAVLLQAWQPRQTKPYAANELAAPLPPRVQGSTDARSVTLYASPPEERRTTRSSAIDRPIDATDAIELYIPADPSIDE